MSITWQSKAGALAIRSPVAEAGYWNTSLLQREVELVQEVQRNQLDIARLPLKQSSDSGTNLLERSWTLFYAGVVPEERQRADVGLLIAPRFLANALAFTPVDERVASLRLPPLLKVLDVIGLSWLTCL